MSTKIEQAAEEALKVIASAAAEAVKVVNASNANDHDLLQRIDVKVEALSTAIKELTDGTARRIADLELEKNDIKNSYSCLYKDGVEKRLSDHDNKIAKNSNDITKVMTWGSAAIIGMGILEYLISNFIINK